MGHKRSWHTAVVHFTVTVIMITMVISYVHASVNVGTTSAEASSSSNATNVYPRNSDIHHIQRSDVEEALDIIDAAWSRSLGDDCVSTVGYKSLPVALDPKRFDDSRRKIDMSAIMLQNLGSMGHTNNLLDAVARSILTSITNAVATRVIILNASTNIIIDETWMKRTLDVMEEPVKLESDTLRVGYRPYEGFPWFQIANDTNSHLRSAKFKQPFAADSYRGWWTFPYLSCKTHQWLMSYNIYVRKADYPHSTTLDYLSVDIDISGLEINQCDLSASKSSDDVDETFNNQMESFRGSHKCDKDTTQCEYRGQANRKKSDIYQLSVAPGWVKGAYICRCRIGFYSVDATNTIGNEPPGFDGTLVEAAWTEMRSNKSDLYHKVFKCIKCAIGCVTCKGPEPCLATYNWPFREKIPKFRILYKGIEIQLLLKFEID
ncbi:hypothetical protein PV327_007428 [Microctonus hyperodae]|uniref:GPR158/179 extracellular domain-containing protein n=1 Tax=Microctonus hyperodae TaxID=165561 RepID=A0AA39G0G7_MICHY|nr:hypothetical protein PV327_007428 [Microctonus hyperodae]